VDSILESLDIASNNHARKASVMHCQSLHRCSARGVVTTSADIYHAHAWKLRCVFFC